MFGGHSEVKPVTAMSIHSIILKHLNYADPLGVRQYAAQLDGLAEDAHVDGLETRCGARACPGGDNDAVDIDSHAPRPFVTLEHRCTIKCTAFSETPTRIAFDECGPVEYFQVQRRLMNRYAHDLLRDRAYLQSFVRRMDVDTASVIRH